MSVLEITTAPQPAVEIYVESAGPVEIETAGPQGPAGATGPQGEIGPQGPAGPDGLSQSQILARGLGA